LNKIKWIIFVIVSVGILAALVIIPGNSQLNVDKINASDIQTATSQNGNIADHVYGDADSKVTLIEYGDFQCPGCGSEHAVVKVILEKYKDKIRHVFRNYPIATSHPNARAAAAAAESAGLQNKYWEMHNLIYESQSDWENLTGTDRNDKFVSYAKQLGLDGTKFLSDMASNEVIKKINFDQALGKKSNVEATPSFYLNGSAISTTDWGSKTKFMSLIDTELTKAGISLPE